MMSIYLSNIALHLFILSLHFEAAFSFTSQRLSESTSSISKFSGNRFNVQERQKMLNSLYAIHEKRFQKKTYKRTDIPPLHASTFIRKEETFPLNSTESFEIDLLYQKQEYEDLVKDSASVLIDSLIDEIEDTLVHEKRSNPHFDMIWFSRLLLLLSAALNGSNFTFVKIMNENIPVQHGTILRFTLAAIATSPWLFRRVHQSTESKQNLDITNNIFLGDVIPSSSKSLGVLLAGFEVGLWTAFGYIAQAIGLETTQASTSAFICSLAVVIIPILDSLSGKKVSPRSLLGTFMAIAGVALLETDNISFDSFVYGNGSFLSDGDLYTLIQPIAFGLGFWRMEHAMRRYPEEAMKLTAVQLSTVAIFSIMCCFFVSGFGGLPTFSSIFTWVKDPIILQSLLWTGLINTALTIYMETLALKSLSAMETTILLSTEPIFGSIFAGLILSESFGLSGFIGAMIISLGCVISNLKPNLKHESCNVVTDNNNY